MGTQRGTGEHVAAVLAGASCIAASAVLVRLSEASAGAAATLRCALALPLLGLALLLERRTGAGRLTRRARWYARAAGVAFGADLVAWSHCIENLGAGLATVLGNLQVLFVAVAAWSVLGERPSRRLLAAMPVMLTGVVLVGGLGGGGYGNDPLLGVVYGLVTSLCYAVYLLVLRAGMRPAEGGAGARPGVVAPLFEATLGGAVTAAVLALLLGDFALGPSPAASLGWLALLATSSQVVGWLLISRSLPVLPAALTSTLLLVQPAGAVALGALVFDERPSAAQLLGVLLLLAGVLVAARRAETAPPSTIRPPAGAPPRPAPGHRPGAPPARRRRAASDPAPQATPRTPAVPKGEHP
ncbi:DMT family transporter [Kitasatospora sp. NPDC096147]|uniref:DMT family transporter n=1 Tax=Kitasatospora sp. NPDC096147 TaxID=3364093 RepID=UPI00381B6A63